MDPSQLDRIPAITGSGDGTGEPAEMPLSASQPSSTAMPSTNRDSNWESSASSSTTSSLTTAESPDAPPPTAKPLPPPQSQALSRCTPIRNQQSSSRLLDLPPDLILEIVGHLDFPSLIYLSRTCCTLYHLASPHEMRLRLGRMPYQALVLSTCQTCLSSNRAPGPVILPSPSDLGYPLASTCIECALRADDPRLTTQRRAPLATLEVARMCRWCGWPILPVTEQTHRPPAFHPKCQSKYDTTLAKWTLWGIIQFGVGVTGAALAWKWYRWDIMVFAPTVVSTCPCYMAKALGFLGLLRPRD